MSYNQKINHEDDDFILAIGIYAVFFAVCGVFLIAYGSAVMSTLILILGGILIELFFVFFILFSDAVNRRDYNNGKN